MKEKGKIKMDELKNVEMLVNEFSKDYMDCLDEPFVYGLTPTKPKNKKLVGEDYANRILQELDSDLDSVGNYY